MQQEQLAPGARGVRHLGVVWGQLGGGRLTRRRAHAGFCKVGGNSEEGEEKGRRCSGTEKVSRAKVWLFPVCHLRPHPHQFNVSRPRFTGGTVSGTNFGLIQVNILRVTPSSEAGQDAPPPTPVLTCFQGLLSSAGGRVPLQVPGGGGETGKSRASYVRGLRPHPQAPVAPALDEGRLGSEARGALCPPRRLSLTATGRRRPRRPSSLGRALVAPCLASPGALSARAAVQRGVCSWPGFWGGGG